MFFVESISYIESKLKKINKNFYQTKNQLVDIVKRKRNLFNCIDIDNVIDINNNKMTKNFN